MSQFAGDDRNIEQRAINVIRGLAMDAPQRANSGHPGTAMALAPLAHVLFTRIMSYDARDPGWFDRDRFVLSNGHASILQYAMLYLTGFGLELDDIEQFRQFGSRTPGHPEVHHLPGVEVTTGPLGQGFAQSVGLAMAEQLVRHRFGPGICDHHVFGICGDGDLMEGVSHEAGSLAGHLGLGRLIFTYDDNHITIDGPTELAYSDNVPKRFESYGWQVIQLGEVANDLDALEAGLRAAMAETERPTLLILRSHIGWPSPHRTDTKEAHGSPLGREEIRLTKELLGLPADKEFFVPDDVIEFYREAGSRGGTQRDAWMSRRETMADEDRERFDASLSGRALKGWEVSLPTFKAGELIATRNAIQAVVAATADGVPGLAVGSADLTGNTGTKLDLGDAMSKGNRGGRQTHYGIREFAMASALNGMALHNGVLPVGGTFFCFSDYCRPAIRLGAMSRAHAVLFFTHDSIGLGEDGPTHQPIEQLASLRAMPDLRLIRPADANECAAAWRIVVEGDGLSALILTRQEVPVLEGTAELAFDGVARGAYVLIDPDPPGLPQLVLVGTGSEVQHCVAAQRLLSGDGLPVRVVSMPSWDLFEAQEEDYRATLLPPGVPVLAVEAASAFGWDRYADATVAIDHYGASAPGERNMKEFGFTGENVAARARDLLARYDKEEP
ncbi:MAG: transketolase [Acidimicrobiales bacterium]